MNKILHFGRSNLRGVTAAVAAAGMIMLGATSCVKRDLYVRPDEGCVMLDFNWQNVIDGESAPEQMSVYFYGENGSLTRGTTENGMYKAKLASGKYKILAFNEGVEGVAYTSLEDFDKAYAYALPLYSNKGNGDDQWIRQPGWLYSANIGELDVNKNDTIQRTLMPKPLVQRIVLNIRLTGDYGAVTEVSAALKGVAPLVRLATGECTDGTASVTQLEPKPLEGGGYTANVLVFGILDKQPDGTPASNSVELGLNFNNGGSQVIEEDISGSAPGEPTDIEINIDIDIEVSATSAMGFVARVTKWEVTDGDVNVDNRPGGKPLTGR